MQITLSPIRMDADLTLTRTGDGLVINGEAFDLSALAPGEEADPASLGCPWLISARRRADGTLELALLLPHGPDAPAETLYPSPVVVTGDGPVNLPPWGTLPDPVTPV